jgi:hypothetical protein
MASFEDLTDAQKATLAAVGYRLFHNPEVSSAAKRLLMKADPKVKFPEIETQDAVESSLEKRDKKIEELEQRLIQESAERNLEKRHEEARARGLDPADVEKAIVERGIGKWETAMEFVELTQRAAAPTPASLNGVGLSTTIPSEDKEFQKDPAAWANRVAHDTIDELRGRKPALRAVK